MRHTSHQGSRNIVRLDPERSLSVALCDIVCRVDLDHGSRRAHPFDFARTMVLVPGGRLAHGLERELLSRARSAGYPLVVPTVVTPAMLLPRFLAPSRPLLTQLGSLLAWRGTVDRLFDPSVEASATNVELARRVAWILGGVGGIESASRSEAPIVSDVLKRAIARRLARIDREVASSMSSFREIAGAAQDAAARGMVTARVAEAWRMLAEVEVLYVDSLSRAGVADRDRAASEILRSIVGGEVGTVSDPRFAGYVIDGGIERIVVLFADPEPVQRALLDVLELRGIRIEVCVHTEEDVDTKGFPVAARWAARRFPAEVLPADRILVAETVADAGEAVVAAIRRLPQDRTPEMVTVMAADEDLERSIDRALQLAHGRACPVGGQEFSSSRLGTLLARLETLLRDGSMEALAAFVRHPDVADKLHEVHPTCVDPGGVVADYWSVTAATRWRDEVAPRAAGADDFAALQAVVAELLAPLLEETGAKHVLGEADIPQASRAWAKPLRAVVRSLSERAVASGTEDAAARELNRTVRTVRLFDRAVAELEGIPDSLADAVEIADVVAVLRESLDRQIVDRTGGGGAGGVELVRWLDVGIADEPHLVLCGMHEGIVPDAGAGDALLTEELRSAAGLPTADRRVARDAWILDGLLLRAASRPGASLRLIVPRKSSDGEPLRPSRFLLRVGAEDLPVRVAQLFEAEAVTVPTTTGHGHGDSAEVALDAATPAGEDHGRSSIEIIDHLPSVQGTIIDRISVTAFRHYLKCPYLFQLRQDPRLRLASSVESARALGGDGFGNLLHAALEYWGKVEAARPKPTTDGAEIEKDVLRALDRVVAERIPRSAGPAVRVQVELVRRRLRRFAVLQKAEADAGWHVRGAELRFQPQPKRNEYQAPRFPNQDGVFLTGQIDRVDRHIESGAWRALDYKSGVDGVSPNDAHKAGGAREDGDAREGRMPGGPWLDLQLPLYRTLLASLPASALGAEVRIEPSNLGYVNLTPKVESSAFTFLEAIEEDLIEAEAEAVRIVTAIRSGAFEPSEDFPLYRGDPLGVLWGEGLRQSSRQSRAEAQAGGAP
ncbi:MAG: PD-(D/E)XK nuclease family protein [bacterium]